MEKMATIEINRNINHHKVRRTRDTSKLADTSPSFSYGTFYFGLVLGLLTAYMIHALVNAYTTTFRTYFNQQIILAVLRSRAFTKHANEAI